MLFTLFTLFTAPPTFYDLPAPEAPTGAAPPILAAMTTRARRRRAGRPWRSALQLVEVNGARRGALPEGDARHMLLQDSLLGALAVQVIWGLCWVASRTLGTLRATLDQR